MCLCKRAYLLLFLLVLFGPAVAAPTSAMAPLRCVTAPPGDPEPWTHNSRVLSSFPPVEPAPVFLGAFRDEESMYELQLWRDQQGVFGELLSPVLDADSPTSRLYDAVLVVPSNDLSFEARTSGGNLRFSGRLEKASIRGAFTFNKQTGDVVLKRLPPNETHGAVGQQTYASRAQFECEMTLFRRY